MGKILQIGEDLDDGRYVVLDQLKSSGCFAEIYKVKKKRVPMECLLKVNLPHEMLDKEAIKASVYEFSKEDHIARTERELEILCWLKHPNIASVNDCIDIKGGYRGIVFQPIEQPRTLRDLMNSMTPMNFMTPNPYTNYGTFRFIKDGLLRALYELSWRKIIHRDITPENIVVDWQNIPYLVDFGLACHMDDVDNRWGSLSYGPPEIHVRFGNHNSDCWHVGIILYEFLTGKHLIDNSPDPKERRERIIAKMKSLRDKNMAIDFCKDLISKISGFEEGLISRLSDNKKSSEEQRQIVKEILKREMKQNDMYKCYSVIAVLCEPYQVADLDTIDKSTRLVACYDTQNPLLYQKQKNWKTELEEKIELLKNKPENKQNG